MFRLNANFLGYFGFLGNRFGFPKILDLEICRSSQKLSVHVDFSKSPFPSKFRNSPFTSKNGRKLRKVGISEILRILRISRKCPKSPNFSKNREILKINFRPFNTGDLENSRKSRNRDPENLEMAWNLDLKISGFQRGSSLKFWNYFPILGPFWSQNLKNIYVPEFINSGPKFCRSSEKLFLEIQPKFSNF